MEGEDGGSRIRRSCTKRVGKIATAGGQSQLTTCCWLSGRSLVLDSFDVIGMLRDAEPTAFKAVS